MTNHAQPAPRKRLSAGLVASVALVLGAACIVGGIYLLAGPGWALVSAGAPFLAFGAVITRGVLSGQPDRRDQ